MERSEVRRVLALLTEYLATHEASLELAKAVNILSDALRSNSNG